MSNPQVSAFKINIFAVFLFMSLQTLGFGLLVVQNKKFQQQDSFTDQLINQFM